MIFFSLLRHNAAGFCGTQVTRLQEQLQTERDLRATLEAQSESDIDRMPEQVSLKLEIGDAIVFLHFGFDVLTNFLVEDED